MKQQLLIVLLCPVLTYAQEVKPVIAGDYLVLIHHNSSINASGKTTDSSNNMRNASLLYNNGHNYQGQFRVNKISIKNDSSVILHPVKSRSLFFGGAATITASLQLINHQPPVQKEYAQGRSLNGAIAWQGPETGELFSFGPALNTLEFDGSKYRYDVNGRLTATGHGNGHSSVAYTNSAFRTGFIFSKDISLTFKYPGTHNLLINAILNAGQRREQTFITTNKNKSGNFSAILYANLDRLKISGNYHYRGQNFSNSNRTGFLNRVYQNSLLSPVSFSVKQGNQIGNAQRSYSPEADNPFFLLGGSGTFIYTTI